MFSIDLLWSIVVILHDKNDKKLKIKCINTHKHCPLNTQQRRQLKGCDDGCFTNSCRGNPAAIGPRDYMKNRFKASWVRGCTTDLKAITSRNTKKAVKTSKHHWPDCLFSQAVSFFIKIVVSVTRYSLTTRIHTQPWRWLYTSTPTENLLVNLDALHCTPCFLFHSLIQQEQEV